VYLGIIIFCGNENEHRIEAALSLPVDERKILEKSY
jgi:hypothetical protein